MAQRFNKQENNARRHGRYPLQILIFHFPNFSFPFNFCLLSFVFAKLLFIIILMDFFFTLLVSTISLLTPPFLSFPFLPLLFSHFCVVRNEKLCNKINISFVSYFTRTKQTYKHEPKLCHWKIIVGDEFRLFSERIIKRS